MPGYSMHLIAASHFLRALSEENSSLEEKIRYHFMMGQLVPDLVPWSPTDRSTGYVDLQHFRDPELRVSKYSDGIIVVPDLTRASEYFEGEIQKRSALVEKAYLSGILFHLWLDYDFFASFLFPKFIFRDGIVTDKATGRTYSYEQFISKKGNGIYNTYDCIHSRYGNEISYDIVTLPVQPEPTHLKQYDSNFDANKNWKAEIERFASFANFTESAIDIDYEELHTFLVESSRKLFQQNQNRFMNVIFGK